MLSDDRMRELHDMVVSEFNKRSTVSVYILQEVFKNQGFNDEEMFYIAFTSTIRILKSKNLLKDY